MEASSIHTLLELDRLARQQVAPFAKQRSIVGRLVGETGRHLTGVVGPRGVGKTVALLQCAVQFRNSLYISADTLEQGVLFECVKLLREKYGITTVCIDEIHFQKDFGAELKKIYDFLDSKVIFTSSVALALYESSTDLSRRVTLYPLFPFSFREYVRFKAGIELPQLTFEDIQKQRWSPDHIRQEYLFDDYLTGGLMPFSLQEPDVISMLRAIAEKVVKRDIPSVRRIGVDEVGLIEKCIEFIAKAGVDGVNYSSLSGNIGITKYKAALYVELLDKAFIVNPLFPAGANVAREPKILLSLPYRLLYCGLAQAVGGLREDFFAEVMRMNGWEFKYLKSTRGEKTPDYLLKTPHGERIIEIGGKGKGRSQFKGISGEKSMILCHPSSTEGIKRPLFMIGYLN